MKPHELSDHRKRTRKNTVEFSRISTNTIELTGKRGRLNVSGQNEYSFLSYQIRSITPYKVFISIYKFNERAN